MQYENVDVRIDDATAKRIQALAKMCDLTLDQMASAMFVLAWSAAGEGKPAERKPPARKATPRKSAKGSRK